MNSLRRRLLQRLSALRDGTTMCPGRLARDCGSNLRAARADLLALAREKEVVLSQRGKAVPSEAIHGPFRVRLAPKN